MFQIPLALALALTGGGIAANTIGARKADRAQASAMAAERKRQGRLDDEAFAINTKSRKRFEGIEPQMQAEAADLTSTYLQGADEPAPFVLPESGSNITVQRTAKEKGEAREETDANAKARADLLALNSIFGDIGIGQARDATRLAGIQGEKRGSQGVLPLELDAAMNEGAGWRLAGDIFGGLGSVATMGALSGATLPGFGLGAGRPLAGTNMLASRQPPAGLLSLFSRG